MSRFELRPHHGLCLLFYVGCGYCPAFTARMDAVQAALVRNPTIRLASGSDLLCGVCPHLADGSCLEKAERYDRRVLACSGLTAGQELPWRELEARLRASVLTKGRLQEVCGDCQWASVCRTQSIFPPDRGGRLCPPFPAIPQNEPNGPAEPPAPTAPPLL